MPAGRQDDTAFCAIPLGAVRHNLMKRV